ncbi:MAG: hypothetical protein U0T73_00810 [Chitinophagales bacterium]
MNYSIKVAGMLLMLFGISGCGHKDPEPETPASVENTYAYAILDKLKGIWDGPVQSSTALGSFPEWIVDFRPVSASQISAKNELDSMNDIHMSFFIAKYNNAYRVCFRNGGSFAGMTRVSYLLADSVSETATQSYYRFSEMVKGKNRAYSEVIFRGDSINLRSYTNKTNTLAAPVMHMNWMAKRVDLTSCQSAVNHFSFPKKELSKDLTGAFNGLAESIIYSIGGGQDPYNEAQQPYLGKTNVTYSFGSGYTADPSKRVMLMITTQPLISGFSMNMAALNTRCRYVLLSSADRDFTFNYMHPGSYYLYALYDADGNLALSSGDWVSAVNTSFTLAEKGTTSVSTSINFTIP